MGARDLKAQIEIEARDQASAVIRSVASELGVLGQAFSVLASGTGLAGVALAGVAAAGLGVVKMGQQISDTVEKLDLLSERTGVSAENLQVLGQVIEQSGGNAEALGTALTFLNRSIATQDPVLKQLGITTKDTFEAFMQLTNILGASSDESKKSEVAFRLLGRGSGELLGLMSKLGTEFTTTEAAMRRSGAIISTEMVPAARALDQQVDQLALNWKGAMMRIQSATVPVASDIVSAFSAIFDQITGIEGITDKLRRQAKEKNSEDRIVELQFLVQYLEPDENSSAAAIKLRRNLQAELNDLLAARPITFDADLMRSQKGDTAPTPDKLAKLNLTGDDKEKQKTPREEMLERIQKSLGQTAVQAAQTLSALEAIEDAQFGQQITEKLTLGPEVPKELVEFNKLVDDAVMKLGVGREEAEALVAAFQEVQATADADALRKKLLPTPDDPQKEVMDRWRESINQITSDAGILDAGLEAVFTGLQDGFSRVFSGLLTEGQTFGSALRSLFSSLVDSILQMLARLAASVVFKSIFNMLSGGTVSFFGITLKALGLGASSSPAADEFVSSGVSAPSGAFGMQRGGDTYNLYTYTPRDVMMEITSPTGRMRRGRDTVNILAER